STIVSDLTLDSHEGRVLTTAPSGEMRSAIDKLKEAVAETGSNRAATAAMANLAEAIHGLVSHMRTEQQMIRDWADAQAAQVREMLSLEKVGKANLEDTLASLRANLALAENERDRLKSVNEGLASGGGRASELAGQLDTQKSLTSRAMAQIELLNQQIAALRRQLAALESALEASESKDKESQTRIADLGQRLNLALAQRVQELSRFRSEFFGR